ncbi:NADPH:quinone reductase [Telmatospirillum sp.]|uniref:NADPH:quinone reductase n=1 Tax=Telmatospirillum sp. TaxID=2079197 RepID=UPI00284F19E4|nr:NADPH:quinone reductase [Telmatospirillum sp.]MDR3435036.1 NADPH:quinone reductase [Telmatospirillum sp.]
MTKKITAVYYEKTGLVAEVLAFGECDLPELAPGEVMVEMHAVGINPADVKRIAGKAPAPDGRRLVPGDDGAGVIVAVGQGVSEKRLGQRVWIYMGRLDRDFGTAASHAIVPAERAVPLPDGVSFESGACLGVPAITAHYALFSDGDIAGQTVLIHGGAGGVGSTAVQLAKWGGATVIATVSGPEKAAVAKVCGADHVVNYRSENVIDRVTALTAGAGVDRVVDVAFGVNLPTNLEVLKPNGVIATYSSDADQTPVLPIWQMLRKNVTVHFMIIYTLPQTVLRRSIRDITAALATRDLTPVVSRSLPLREFGQADQIVGRLSGIGNVVLLPDIAV